MTKGRVQVSVVPLRFIPAFVTALVVKKFTEPRAAAPVLLHRALFVL